MLEKRRSPRVPLKLNFHICDLYKHDSTDIHHLKAPIVLTDISEYGIGFISECLLPLQYHFKMTLNLEKDKESLVVLKIIRCLAVGHSHYSYGCEFIALDDTVKQSIREYAASKTKYLEKC